MGVVIISLIIFLNPNLKYLDPCLSIFFSVISVSFSIPVFKALIGILLDAVPHKFDLDKFVSEMKKVEHVVEVHDVHVWEVIKGKLVMTAHLISNEHNEFVLKQCTIIARKWGVYHSTIQVESVEAKYKIDCTQNVHK